MTPGKKFWPSLVLLLLPTVAATYAANQTNLSDSASANWVVRSWRSKDGLPQNTPNAMVQSRDGYLWVGTSGGLARFDGVRFQTFGLQDGLQSVQIFRLCEDRRGLLWVGTIGGGLSRWDNGKFITYGKAEGFAAAAVHALAADPDGSLWIGTEAGLVRWQDGVFRTMGPETGLPAGLVRALLLDSKGVLWVSLPLEGLYFFQGGRFIRAGGVDSAPAGVYSLLEDRDGTIWAGSGSGNLWQGRDGSWKRYDSDNGLPRDDLQALAQDGEGTVWVGSRDSGLYFSQDGSFHKLATRSGLTENSVCELNVDREGTVWVGIVGGGLHRLSRRILQQWGKAEGLTDLNISSVAEGSASSLWVATQNDGLWRFLEQRFRKFDDPAVINNFRYVYSTVAGEDGSIWVAGEQFLLCLREGHPPEPFLAPPVRGEAIRALCADGTNVWLGTYHSALLKFDGNNVRVMATNGSFGGGITSLVREGEDTLWIGTSDGLYHWARGTVKSFSTSDGLLTPNIRALHRDPDGTLWIGTLGGGLARLRDGRITNITKRQGLVDDVISQIVADDYGHLWLGCDRGLVCLARREIEELADGKTAFVHPLVLGAGEGMANEQCTGGHSPTALKLKDGKLIFPTLGGLVEIDPRRLDSFTAALPKAIIEQVMLDEVQSRPSATLVVPPGDHHVEIHYTAPSLRGGEWVRFRTQLEGSDAGWVMVGARRTASYAGLRPGSYVFRVAASDSRGVWNDNAASLAILVKPHFWQTLWFGSLIGLATVGLAVAGYRQRIGKLETQRQAQERFTRQLISAQEAERARLARELHDDITQRLAHLAIDAGLVERAGAAPQISDAMRGVREGLVRLSEDVHALSYRLHSSLLEDLGLAEALKAECERYSRQESIHTEVKLLDLPPTVPRESALGLFRIAQEALRNVARHARATKVDLTLRTLDDGIQLAVRDNGVGFDPSHKREHVSLGLASMRERVLLLGGELDIESAPSQGTTILVSVPLKLEQL